METGKIHELIPQLIGEIQAVGKHHHNLQQNYAYRASDDVVAELKPLFAKHGVFVCPIVLAERVEQVAVGKQGTKMFHVMLKVEHRFYANDGSYVAAVTVGEAIDSGDKAANKAMTSAFKYALTETLCIPTSDPKDVEQDHNELAQETDLDHNGEVMPDDDWGANNPVGPARIRGDFF